MRILVYGAGVQGCQLAHSLAQNKKNVVTLLARGEWKEVIDQKGLTIRHMLQRKTTVDRMQTTDVLAPEDVYDLVFVTVQAGQLADVLPILKANRSQYFIFVGNDPYAQEMLQAMQRPVDKIAFGFQNNAGRREHDRLVSVHMGMGMTVGGATAPLSGAFRLRLQAAFEGTHYKLTYYSDMAPTSLRQSRALSGAWICSSPHLKTSWTSCLPPMRWMFPPTLPRWKGC